MGYFKCQEKDFVERTIAILEQYEIIKEKTPQEYYDITLLMNCSLGLLILPQQVWFDRLPKDIIDQEKWGIDPSDISTSETISKEKKAKVDEKSVRCMARHIRNSISHYRFNILSSNDTNLDYIEIEDKLGSKTTFKAEISIEHFRTFVLSLANFYLEEMVK